MPVYLDHNATTPLDPRVLDAMLPHLTALHGNASSVHRYGRAARNALDAARRQVAELAGVHFSQVIFTSGGTEANNLALQGAAARLLTGRVLVSAVEHAAVLEPAQKLSAAGWRVERIPVDARGRVDMRAFDKLLRQGEVRLVSVMAANNETGVIQDIAAIAERARAAGVLLHCDAVQAAGKVPLDFTASGAQLMTVSAHKLYGPKGAGALIFDRSVDITPLLPGGGQEQGLRGGTENVAAIVGFGKAAELACAELASYGAHVRALRDQLEQALQRLPGISVFAADATRLPNTVQFGVQSMDGETVQMGLDRQGVAVSTGSACHNGTGEPSHVLLAMGIDPTLARCAIRVSFGKDNSAGDVTHLLSALQNIMGALPTAVMENAHGG